jgi:hypothetical protein
MGYNGSMLAAELPREGESPEEYAARTRQIEGKRRAEDIQNEPLSYIEDYPYITYYGGYKKFYQSPKSHFVSFSKGKMKTFFEEWMQEASNAHNIADIREAYDAAVSFKIPLNTQLLEQATTTVKHLLNEGMIFLTRTLPPKDVHRIGDELQKLAHSVR